MRVFQLLDGSVARVGRNDLQLALVRRYHRELVMDMSADDLCRNYAIVLVIEMSGVYIIYHDIEGNRGFRYLFFET